MQTKKSEIWVGAFLIIALCAVLFLCLKVADIRSIGSEPTYRISATFDNIGGLKAGSPVKVGGVVVGRVSSITLDKNYSPKVEMDIEKKYNQIPSTSTLAVRTSGLLGEQFLALNIGFEDPDMGTTILKDGGSIQDTKSALVLEDLIGQFLYKSGGDKDKTVPNAGDAQAAPDAVAAPQPAATLH
ncbi:outer membrane lipid asymmetry maintenance protein MlaD [Hafnia psychrotolerans]|jgi:phospholipid/cholesterol/gamma-HCH transport system substrate-binding protein|uniref:Outer membrane lipid asymmetry maintenance protein MlaD n=1 Tax=Hafnia psychrotolerans TaxID=1477018 RepID=A0ABQ1H617_9GAMM|nr:outer membrane lipid asymmetry maintenance protein MlaD [Hafnia psychrotolerans]GGA58808.1 outer membrane lipid asymmetry maintenance protein MlaD [Hafnia psychrotolerans]